MNEPYPFKPIDPRDVNGTRSDWDKATDALGHAATSRVINTGRNIGNSLRQAGQGILSAGQVYYDEQQAKMEGTRNDILNAPMNAVRGLTGMLSPTPVIQDMGGPSPVPSEHSGASAHAADTLMNRGIEAAPTRSAHENLMANAATMFGAGAGQSSSNPLTLDQQRQMGMEPQRVDQWGKPLAEAAGPKMETRADGLQGLATTYSPGSQPSLRSSAGVAPEPITPQQAPSTAANTGLPRMIANERTGGGINVMPQGAGTFS